MNIVTVEEAALPEGKNDAVLCAASRGKLTKSVPRRNGEDPPLTKSGNGGESRSTAEEAAVPLLPPPLPQQGSSRDRWAVEARGRQLGNGGCSADIRVQSTETPEPSIFRRVTPRPLVLAPQKCREIPKWMSLMDSICVRCLSHEPSCAVHGAVLRGALSAQAGRRPMILHMCEEAPEDNRHGNKTLAKTIRRMRITHVNGRGRD